MKIDWKEIAASQVYIELKKDLIHRLNELNIAKQQNKNFSRHKKTYYKNFYKIISRAKHIAKRTNITLVQALEHMKSMNNNYLSVFNINCIVLRLDQNNPLCWAQKLQHNCKPFRLSSRKKHPKHRWDKEYKKGGKYHYLKTGSVS